MGKRNTITLSGQSVNVSVSVFLFKEGDAFIAYCPSLDLSGYDNTEYKARADFEYMLREWLQEQVPNGTLQEDLARHGWKMGHDGAIGQDDGKFQNIYGRGNARQAYWYAWHGSTGKI